MACSKGRRRPRNKQSSFPKRLDQQRYDQVVRIVRMCLAPMGATEQDIEDATHDTLEKLGDQWSDLEQNKEALGAAVCRRAQWWWLTVLERSGRELPLSDYLNDEEKERKASNDRLDMELIRLGRREELEKEDPARICPEPDAWEKAMTLAKFSKNERRVVGLVRDGYSEKAIALLLRGGQEKKHQDWVAQQMKRAKKKLKNLGIDKLRDMF